MELSLRRIAEFIAADSATLNDPELAPAGYSIDSRTIQPGELFFAVRGERLDGHDFVEAALPKGAPGAVVAADQISRFSGGRNLLPVRETLPPLQTLDADVHRIWAKAPNRVNG